MPDDLFDYEADVLVVGSGGAAFSAAIVSYMYESAAGEVAMNVNLLGGGLLERGKTLQGADAVPTSQTVAATAAAASGPNC